MPISSGVTPQRHALVGFAAPSPPGAFDAHPYGPAHVEGSNTSRRNPALECDQLAR